MMVDRDFGVNEVGVSHPLVQDGTSEATLRELAFEMQRTAFELRRETVAAVARQQELRREAFAARERADAVERRACRAFAKGDSLLARQILARDMCLLKTCEALESRLTDANHSVAGLLRRLVQTEDRARLAWRRKEEIAKGGRGC
jgi:phage shock protein A